MGICVSLCTCMCMYRGKGGVDRKCKGLYINILCLGIFYLLHELREGDNLVDAGDGRGQVLCFWGGMSREAAVGQSVVVDRPCPSVRMKDDSKIGIEGDRSVSIYKITIQLTNLQQRLDAVPVPTAAGDGPRLRHPRVHLLPAYIE